CSPTCSATRPSTPRRAARSGSPPSAWATRSWCGCGIRGWGSRRRCCPASSTSSCRATPRSTARPAGSASGSRSCTRSSSCPAGAPDVVLSDLGLPSLDGYEFARRLRQQPGFGRVLLVALSGYGREEDKRRSLEAGFDHHLVKPPDMDVLQALLAGVAAASAEQGARADRKSTRLNSSH